MFIYNNSNSHNRSAVSADNVISNQYNQNHDSGTQPDYFLQIPAEVWTNKDLSFAAKIFYGDVLFLTHANGFCTQKNAFFARNHGVSTRSVENWISELKNQNLIRVELIRKPNKQVEVRKIFALVKIQETASDRVPRGTLNEAGNEAEEGKGGGEKKKPYGEKKSIFLTDTEISALKEKYSEDAIKKAFKIYEDWKSEKGASPKSDFQSITWAFERTAKKPVTKTATWQRITAVKECGCDEVSEEALAALPF